jgi:hypothetical protein
MTKTWIGCADGNFRKGRPAGLLPAAIVIHVMDGTLTGTDSWFNDPSAAVSSHYGVGKSGDVHQYVQEQDTAFHAGTVVNPTWTGIRSGVNPNFYTIGIEHEGMGDEPWPWPDPQLDASAALIAEIAGRWKIPLDLDHVVPHHSIRASKTCPGDKVVIGQILARIPPEAAPPALPVPAITQVRVLTNVNVRFQKPGTSARIVRILPAQTQLTVRAFTDSGERVADNPFWYKDADGNYIWAGATDVPQPV